MTRLSRRDSLSVAAAGLGATLFAGSGPENGSLKRHVKGRTIDVHTHILGTPRRAGTPGVPAAGTKPAAQLPPVTPEQRAEALKYFSRFKHGVLEFDSPRQEDLYVRKYVHRRRDEAQAFEDNAALFLAEMDEAGIDTAVVLLLDFAAPLFSDGPADAATERAEAAFAACAALCDGHPGRFIPFAGIDVRRGKAGTRLLEKAVKQYGFRGCGEIVTTLWHTRPDDRERMYPYYEKALELSIPVMIDCTMDLGYTEPRSYEAVAKDFPKLRICLGGAGIRVAPVKVDGAGVAACDRMLQLACQYENLWLDLDDWQAVDRAGIRRYLDFLRRALNGPARGRVMFGSDYPIFAWMYREREWIDTIIENADTGDTRFTAEELDLFFAGNAARYLSATDDA